MPAIEPEVEDDEIITLPADEEGEVTVEVETDSGGESDDVVALRRQLVEAQTALNTERASRQQTEVMATNRLAEETLARAVEAKRGAESRSATAQAELAAAKAAYVQANESGRFAEAADIAERIADARNRLNASQHEIQQIEAYIANPPRPQPHTQQQAPQQSSDPVTALIASVQSPEGRRWLTAHTDVARRMALDQRYFARVTAADSLAYAELGERDTPAYFEFLEGQLGLRGGSQSKGTTSAAPARRAAPRANSQTTERTIKLSDVVKRLTPEMKMAAKTSFPNLPEEEARRLYAQGLVKAKRTDPTFLPDFRL